MNKNRIEGRGSTLKGGGVDLTQKVANLFGKLVNSQGSAVPPPFGAQGVVGPSDDDGRVREERDMSSVSFPEAKREELGSVLEERRNAGINLNR